MVLATGLAFLMLFFGGGGGLINMSYGMNAMVHNTSWVTAHFHLIFGGTVVIMYFAIAYAMWPAMTGRAFPSLKPLTLQLWLWFVGMMVMTLPWHYTGLQGQWRRVAAFDYSDPMIASWGPWVIVSLVGGIILAVSALLFVYNLAMLHRRAAPRAALPKSLMRRPSIRRRAFRRRSTASASGTSSSPLLMLLAYGYPIAQFFIDPPPQAVIHRLTEMADDLEPRPDHSPGWRPGGAARGRPSLAVLGSAASSSSRFRLRAPRPRHHPGGAARECRHLSMSQRCAARPAWKPARRPSQPPGRDHACRSAKSAGIRRSCRSSPPATRRGAQLAAQTCAACHGDKGFRQTTIPSLAGQSRYAIYKQLHDYRTGARAHPQMTGVAKALAVTDLASVSAYFAAAGKGICRASAGAISRGAGNRAAGVGRRQPSPHSGLPELPRQRRGRTDRNARDHRPEP